MFLGRAVLVHKGTMYILRYFPIFSTRESVWGRCDLLTHSNSWSLRLHIFLQFFRLVYEKTSHLNFQEKIDFEHKWYRYSFENILKTYLIWMTTHFQVWKWKRFFKIQNSFVKIHFQLNIPKSKLFNLTHYVYKI